ncbi:MAG TPA: DNA-binding domain-containing protein [Caulobacteraceae bacterium]|jgi:hypothetical protein
MPDAAFERRFGAALLGLEPVADATLARALAIHRNTAFKAAEEALADNYPVLRGLCGDEAFAACAHAFVLARPPAEPRLCFYGAGLPAFVANWPPFQNTPWLADVCELERLAVEALFAADAIALDGAAVAARLDPDRALTLHPAVRFARFASPAGSIWLAHQDEAPEGALEAIAWRPEAVVVTRPGDSLMVEPLDPAAAALLEACVAGASLRTIAAASWVGDDVATAFSALITAGAFA